MKKDGHKLNQQAKRRFLTRSNDVSAKIFFIGPFSSTLLTGSILGTLTIINPLNQYVFAEESEEDGEKGAESEEPDEVSEENDDGEEEKTNDNDYDKSTENDGLQEQEEVRDEEVDEDIEDEGKEEFKIDSFKIDEDEDGNFITGVDGTGEEDGFEENGERENLRTSLEEDEVTEEDDNLILAGDVDDGLEIQSSKIPDRTEVEDIGSLQDDRPTFSAAESPEDKQYSESSYESSEKFSNGENGGNNPTLNPKVVSPIIAAQTLPGGVLDKLSDIDEIFDKGKIKSGPLYKLPAPKEVSPTDFKQTKIKNNPVAAINYQDKIVISGAGPNGETIEFRTHSTNPNAPNPGYTTQANIKGTKTYFIPNENGGGVWKPLDQMTEAEKAASHIPAPSGSAGKTPASAGFVSLKVLGKIVTSGFAGLSLYEFHKDTQQGNWLGAAGSGRAVSHPEH